jgi:phosphohistidine phosphatase
MRLYLLRHANAAASASTDSARPLTEKGLAQAARVAFFCRDRGIAPELILTSPFVRAEQTAAMVAAELGRETVAASFLASGMRPAVALEELRGYGRFDPVLLVGHEPDLSLLTATLLGLPDSQTLRIGKATLVALDVDALQPGGARLEFLIPEKFV